MNNVRKLTLFSYLLLVGLMLTSCELLGPRDANKLPLTPVKEDQTGGLTDVQNKLPTNDNKPPKTELYPGTSRFVPDRSTQHKGARVSGEGSYNLNFDEADLGEVAKVILSDILKQNYVLSPKVTGKVTLQTTEALTKDELLPTLEMVLSMNNAALVKEDKIYHIEPTAEALYSSTFSAPGSAGRAGYQVRVIPVKNVAVEDIVDVIKPMVHEKTILTVDGARNILVASGTPDELERIMDMVATFDIDVLKGRSFGLFPLAHVEPETIIKELKEVFNKKEKSDDSSFFRFIPIERLNAILAITHQASYLKDIETWIFRLDKANSATGGGVNVYKVQHVNAEELAETLNEIFNGASGSSSSKTKKSKTAKVAPGQQSAELTNKEPAKQRTQKSTGNKSSQTGDAQVSNVGEVRIIADLANNAIVTVATAQEYEVILPVIKQLDLLPLQVLIDATIVSVKLTDKLSYGIQWFLDHQGSSISSGNDKATLGSVATATASAFASGGLTAVYNSGVVNALLSSQATKGNVNVISSPSLMVLNNQEAKINVGDQVPLQTSTSSVPIASNLTGGSFAQSNSIQYKDTGVTLEVTPRVNINGMVIMEIHQIVSSVVPTVTGVTSTATINKKEIESSVAVHDGETIVLGGLIDSSNTRNVGGIPYLSDLPWIGPLFGNTLRDDTKNELVVLITPRVVKSKQDSRLISDEFNRKLTGIYQEKAVVSEEAAKAKQ